MPKKLPYKSVTFGFLLKCNDVLNHDYSQLLSVFDRAKSVIHSNSFLICVYRDVVYSREEINGIRCPLRTMMHSIASYLTIIKAS